MRREARAFVSGKRLVLWYITLNYQNIVDAEIKLENLLTPFNRRWIHHAGNRESAWVAPPDPGGDRNYILNRSLHSSY